MWFSKGLTEYTAYYKSIFAFAEGGVYDLSGMKCFCCILREYLHEPCTLYVWLAGGLFIEHLNELFMYLHENHN